MSKEHKTAEIILKKRMDWPLYVNGDPQIISYRHALKAMEEYASQYKSALEEREREIKELKAVQDVQSMVVDLKDKEIQELNDKLESQSESLQMFCHSINDLNKEIEVMDAELSTLRAEKSQPIDVEGLFNQVFDIFYDTSIRYDQAEQKIKELLTPYLSKGTKPLQSNKE